MCPAHPLELPLLPMLKWQPTITKVNRQMIHYYKSFKLICHMPIFQLIYQSSKNQVDSKEDMEKTSPNAGMAASMIKIYQSNHSACKELPFDILHAYSASNMRVFKESGSSKKKTLKTALLMLEWQVVTIFFVNNKLCTVLPLPCFDFRSISLTVSDEIAPPICTLLQKKP